MLQKPFLVGITGGSASGKTRFIRQLLHAFSPDQVCLISQDNYYRDRDHQPRDPLGIENFDLPESIDHQSFIDHVEALKNGETVYKKEYTFNNPNIEPKMLEFKPAPIIVVEGIFVFSIKEILDQLDLRLFIDAREHIKLRRRIKRDGEERGYGLEDVLYRYEHHVAPTFEKFIKPYMHDADFIIPNNHAYDVALEVIVAYLNQKIQ